MRFERRRSILIRQALRCTLAVAALVWLSPSGFAQTIYQCRESGKITFSQLPCSKQVASAASSKSSASTSNPKPTPPALATSIEERLNWKTYDVAGDSAASIWASLNLNGPKVNNLAFHGLAKWDVRYSYQTRLAGDEPKMAGNLCRFSEIKPMLEGEILLPRWINESQAPQELRQRWARFSSALKLHEEGHIQHGRELAQLLQKRLLSWGDFPCTQAQEISDGEFRRQLLQAREKDKEYDRRTQHGITQGAKFQ